MAYGDFKEIQHLTTSPIKKNGGIGEKKEHTSSGDARSGSYEDIFIKGARSATGTYTPSTVTAEKGKKVIYSQERSGGLFSDPVYTKQKYKKKKGSASGLETWEAKKPKEISKKKYERQIERKSKRYN